MALKDAEAFWTRVRDDLAFRGKLEAATDDLELSAIIIEAGFTLTADELKTSLEDWKTKNAAGRELTDEELARVAGGGFGSPMSLPHLSDIKLGLQIVQPGSIKGGF